MELCNIEHPWQVLELRDGLRRTDAFRGSNDDGGRRVVDSITPRSQRQEGFVLVSTEVQSRGTPLSYDSLG